MKKIKHRFLNVAFWIIILSATTFSQDYAWPTDASQLFTSSFAESRGGRFHAGVDFKTWGVTGYPIYAVRDGYVSRIRVSPFGYGRALYLTLDTGEIVVYGHLEKFNDEIEAYVKAAQKRKNSFDIQLYPKNTDFPVKKGDLIARSGDTGVGYPHLHFEIRDAASNPINPLLKGYTVVDNVAPTITKVLIQPLDALSSVDGDFMPKLYWPSPAGGGTYRINGSVVVAGRVAFGIAVFDEMDGVSNKFGTYRNELYIDEELVFASRYDKFAYALNNHFDLDRDYRQVAYGNGYIYNLFRDFSNKLTFYSSNEVYAGVLDFVNSARLDSSAINPADIVLIPPGVLQLDGGEHTFKIVVQDFWGNASTVTGRLLVDGEQLLEEKQAPVDTIYGPMPPNSALISDAEDVEGQTKDIKLDVTFFDRFLRLKLSPRRLLAEAPVVSGWLCSGKTWQALLIKTASNSYVGAWPLSGCDQGPLPLSIQYITQAGDTLLQNEWIDFTTIPRGQSKTIYSKDGNCKIDFSANSLFKDIFVRTETLPPTSAYSIEGAMYRIFPFDVPLDKGATLSIFYPDSAEMPNKLGIYVKAGDRMRFIGNDRNAEAKRITAQIGSFGTFTLVRDVEPPSIIAFSPVQGTRTQDTKPLLRAVFKDELSGIAGEADRVMKLDGRKVIAEFDPEKLLLFYKPDEPLAKGEHTVELYLRDRSGNVAVRENTFYID